MNRCKNPKCNKEIEGKAKRYCRACNKKRIEKAQKAIGTSLAAITLMIVGGKNPELLKTITKIKKG